jgi:hypothetical protein
MATRPLDLIVISLLLAGPVAAHAGDLYQWKDSKGVTHYSDAPPPKGRYAARTVHVQDAAPQAVPADASKPAKPPSTVAERARSNCETATANLKLLDNGGDIGLDADHDGKPDAPLDARDATRQRQIAQGNIAKFCSQTTAATP